MNFHGRAMETYAMFPTIRRIPYAIVLHYKFETLNLDMTKHSMTLCYPFNEKMVTRFTKYRIFRE